MPLKKRIVKKITPFTYMLILITALGNAQVNIDKPKMKIIDYKYGAIIELTPNNPISINDSLTLELTYFTHKRPYIDGPTKATATVIASTNTKSKELNLSIYGVEGKSQSEDGYTETNRYSSDYWMDYHFQLKTFNYDKAIDIIILKKQNE